MEKQKIDHLVENVIQNHYRMNKNDEEELRNFLQYVKNYLYQNKRYCHHRPYARAKLIYSYVKKQLDYYDKLEFEGKLISNDSPFIEFETPLTRPRYF